MMGYLIHLQVIFYYTTIIAKYDELSRDKYPKLIVSVCAICTNIVKYKDLIFIYKMI